MARTGSRRYPMKVQALSRSSEHAYISVSLYDFVISEAATHWRKGDEESSSEEVDEETTSGGEGEEESKEVKAKGVSHLIETKNPNRTGAVKNIFDETAPMSRRE
ncbi:unnamed protein product, partial [Dibothriocephalus latus]